MLFPTTTVGSFPKPDYLKKARTQFQKGKLSCEELKKLEERATREVIQLQEEVGLDVLVDGEMYRGDMAAYFAESYEGFASSGLVRSYGNRYYRKPIIKGKIRRPKPVTVDWFRFAQSLTKKPVKGMLTGPYTMMDWSFDEHYDSRRDACLALAEVIHQEAMDLVRAGAQYVQIDEPAVSVRPEELPLAIEALGAVTNGLKAKTITHICYGAFDKIYPDMLKLPVDQIDLEMSNSAFDMLELFRKHPFTKEIGLGVLDVHSHTVEKPEVVVERIRQALTVFPAERVFVDPDCGLKTRTTEESRAKLTAMVAGVRRLREELSGRANGSKKEAGHGTVKSR